MSVRPLVTVVIPVKNAVSIIGRVLTAVQSQRTEWPWDVLVIDSGSNDGTLEVIRGFADVRLVQIPPHEFGHGRTRNLGVELSDGDFVAFLTHDAIPANDAWLQNLVAPMLEDARIAGVFGRHIAHDGANPCVRRELEGHFKNLRRAGSFICLDDAQRYAVDQGYRQLLHFYSDNNSCLRKAVWREIPYPEVDFAEDQLWAKRIIERGYAKGYAHDAVVKHSHEYGIWETFQRSFDEASAFRSYFGYVLATSPRQALTSAAACARRDFGFMLRHESGGLRKAIGVAFSNVAKQAGYFLGARSSRLPSWSLRVLSLDRRLKYGPLKLKGAAQKFIGVARREGIRPAMARLLSFASRTIDQQPVVRSDKVDVSAFFRALSDPSSVYGQGPILAVSDDQQAPLDALWFIPDFGPGSGGHLNLFRFLRGLERMGLSSAVVSVGPNAHASPGASKALIRTYYADIEGDVYFERDCLPPARRVIATSWLTAYYLRHYVRAGVEKYYFVQDYEPMFYPVGFDSVAAGRTYEMGFKTICAGPWIAEILRERHGVEAVGTFGFSYDQELYVPCVRRDRTKRVFFYARPPTARRGFELGMLALDIVGRECAHVHFIFAGWDMAGYRFDHVHLNAGVLPSAQLPDLYSQCDVALVLSFSNMSLLPYEVMASGCAVVTNDDPCATWGLDPEAATFAEPTAEAIAAAIIDLLADDERRARQIDAAYALVRKTSWDEEIGRVHAVLMANGPAA